jgi:hypothetical protein
MTWLLTLGITLAIVAIVVALGASYYFWKKHKDISDMIQIANSGSCINPDYGKCFVNTIVDKFGFIRAKEVFLGLGQSATNEEQNFMNVTITTCKCDYNYYSSS